MRPLRLVPIACAASSIRGIENFLQIASTASTSNGAPNRCTAITALGRLQARSVSSSRCGSIARKVGSLSTNTGLAPTRATTPAVAKNE
jgi:hypothetical protein